MPLRFGIPDSPENLFSLITSEQNKALLRIFQELGVKEEKVHQILKTFFHLSLALREVTRKAGGEWIEDKDWRGKIKKRYQMAIRALEGLLNDKSPTISSQKDYHKRGHRHFIQASKVHDYLL